MPPATDSSTGPCLIKIGEKWVNCERWKRSHPGGAEALERVTGTDATDQFMCLHSKEARAQVERMKSVDPPAGYDAEADPSMPSAATLSFRKMRAELEEEGWFERDYRWESFYMGMVLGLTIVGTYFSRSHPWLAIFLIGLGQQQGGWAAHDWMHARGRLAWWVGRISGAGVVGLSGGWWSEKHNKHHVHTNQVGIDDDIANDPVLHLLVPSEKNDVWFRRYQHYYYHLAYTALYASWRLQSFQYAWARKHKREFQLELALFAINYLWLLSLGPFVALGVIIWGGWLVAEVVTATHQSEEMLQGQSFQFAEDQFHTTRDVVLASGFFNWFWGGMQWQLEHHLFPFMPKYKYALVAPRVRAWAKENGIQYRSSGPLEILQLNFQTMQRYALMTWQEYQKQSN